MTNRVTRLAPSPTGTLHLGNARTFLVNWAMARQRGWSVLLRIEDLDRSRVRAGAAEQVMQLLQWLGIDCDGEPLWQSRDLEPYRSAMRKLTDLKLAYACALTRSQIQQAASAPHSADPERRFPPELRPRSVEDDFTSEHSNYRFVVSDEPVVIADMFAGKSTHHPSNEVGDFVIWTKLGVPAYQLAVVVDDARQGVTDVVRGDDLLASAARQTLLYRGLQLPPPTWWHLPLVLRPDGRRLAKRHGDTHLETYRSGGVSPQRVIGLLAFWCGVCDSRSEMTIQDFRDGFDVARLSRDPITFTEDDHQWLLHRS